MANGKQTAYAAIKMIDTSSAYIIVSNGEAFGVAEFQEPAQIKTKEFGLETWQEQHRITPRERRQWWPDAETFYIYTLKSWLPYDGVKLFEDGRITDEPRLTSQQWKLISTAKELPKQIILEKDFVALTVTDDNKAICGDKGFYTREVKGIIDATFNQAVDCVADCDGETIPIYSLALVRNPRMRVSKKNSIPEGDAEKQEGEQMPFRIVHRDDEYCVVKVNADDTDGDVSGCHDTEAEAEAQLVALNINVVAEEEGAIHDKPRKRKPHKKEAKNSQEETSATSLGVKATRIGDFLRNRREELEMTISDIANDMPITAGTIGDIELGGIETPSEPVLRAFARVLDVSLDRLIALLPEDAMPRETIAKSNGFLSRLKLAAKNIIDMVSLAEKETEEDPEGMKLFMNDVGIGQKLVNGELWHFTYSTNAFEDREGETFSTKALENYVSQNEENETKGFFNFWHINAEDGHFNTDFARKEWQGVAGRFLVEAGPYLRGERGKAAEKFFKNYGAAHPAIAPEGWGCSPEYRFLPEERATGTYENIWITRTSTLPRFAAANVWTETRQMSKKRGDKMALSEQQKQAAIEIFGNDMVTQMIQEAEQKTTDLEAAGIAHKATTSQDSDEKPAEVNIDLDQLAAEVGKQFQMDLTPIAETMEAVSASIKTLEERLAKLEETKATKDQTETPRFVFNMKRASEMDETIVTDDDGLKNRKPTEAAAKGKDPWTQIFSS
jgi:transcriptional regulator with XRE-family HTH domain